MTDTSAPSAQSPSVTQEQSLAPDYLPPHGASGLCLRCGSITAHVGSTPDGYDTFTCEPCDFTFLARGATR